MQYVPAIQADVLASACTTFIERINVPGSSEHKWVPFHPPPLILVTLLRAPIKSPLEPTLAIGIKHAYNNASNASNRFLKIFS